MMSEPLDSDHGDLIDRASHGDQTARAQLLALHRERLRRMVALRMDPRLSARLDPSDVVQDALAEAHRQLPEYLQERPLPFYPWLRQIAWNRLIDLHRRHVLAQRRSVNREEAPAFGLPDESALALADCLLGSSTSPSAQARREEQRDRVQQALLLLNERDREVLVLRYLEKLSTSEIASVLGIREGAVKVRHLRALERMRNLMDVNEAGDSL
jgi:RNA polymerase sigma-70 factor, ECF subfamily